MKKNKLILVGVNGRKSTQTIYQNSNGLHSLYQRFRKKTYQGYVIFNDCSLTGPIKFIGHISGENSIIFRWGTREILETNKTSIIYNKAAAIAKASNKSRARVLLNSGGVRVPKIVDLLNYDTVCYPIIQRPLKHKQGRDLVVIHSKEEFKRVVDEKHYYAEFIDKQQEFRVHCAHGKVLAVIEKPKIEDSVAWNRAVEGSAPHTYVRWSEANHDVCKQALNAVKTLGLDVGAVDIILKDEKAYVLEVNTSPQVNNSPYVAEKYSKYFNWLFSSEKRRPHWPFEDYKKTKSFFWKKKQFK